MTPSQSNMRASNAADTDTVKGFFRFKAVARRGGERRREVEENKDEDEEDEAAEKVVEAAERG